MKYSQSNLEQLFQLIGSMPNQEYGRTAHFDYIKTAASAWPNQLINFRTEGKEIIHILNQIEKDALTGRIPELLMLNPSKDENLSKEPFIRKKYSSSVWTAMTHNLQFISPQKQIENFHIKLIDNGDDLKLWLALVASELMNDHPLNASVFNALLNHKAVCFFLGIANGQAVATSFLYAHGAAAGVYLVSTAKSHRKRGFGKALTVACLHKAKELGCYRVDIQATGLGKPVYASLGFVSRGDIDVYRVKV